MEKKNGGKKRIMLILRIAAILCGGILCVPVTVYLNTLIGNGETDTASLGASVCCCCLAALTVLAVIAGLRALTGRTFRLTLAVILLTAAAGIAAGFVSYRNIPELQEVIISPRPTVTPPAVIIEEKAGNPNPESGSVFYRKYYDNPVRLTFDNAGASDLFVKLREKSGMDVLSFYVRGYEIITVDAPVGTYEFVCAFGKNWVDEDNFFGENTEFRKSKELYTLNWGGECEISVSKNASELLDVSRGEFSR